jgi:Xaa-Pro aminopeptidase
MDKIKRFQENMPDSMQAAVLMNEADRFYLTGMKSSAGTVLITRKNAYLIIDFRYFEEAEAKVKNCRVIEQTGLYEQIRGFLAQEGLKELSVHSGRTSLAEFRMMETALEGIALDGSDQLAKLMETLRRVKDEYEIDCHRNAQNITDQVFTHICDYIRPGMTELEIAQEIGTSLTALGSDDKHFNFIVASGPNSSLPHGFATRRVVQNGDFITMDFGAVCKGYLADMTRTVALGHVTEEQRKIYTIVQEARKRAFDMIRPGVKCNLVDAAARDYIYSQGYRGCFSHGLGHSVGVEVHENPRFNETCEDLLVPGLVMTVEPGIYLKQRFGVRIEDMIVIREDGYEDLTKSPEELILL